MIAAAPAVVCAHTIRAAFTGQPGVAFVSWVAGEEGGMSLFHHRGAMWCRTASGGGAFGEADIVGFDGINRQTAHRLFQVKPTETTARAR